MTVPETTSGRSRRKRLLVPGALVVLGLLIAGVATIRDRQNQNAVLRADPDTILANLTLRKTALSTGKRVFEENCVSCHGDNAKGNQSLGVPDLTDDDQLYDLSSVAKIEDIARYGIRAHNKHGWNLAIMPAYASAVPDPGEKLTPLTPAQINDLTQFLLSFTARATDTEAAKRGAAVYEPAGCWDCHGHDLGGDVSIGAPTLTDDIWLYGGNAAQIRRTLERGRSGMSPAYLDTLSAAELRDVAVYVASLAPQSGK